MMVMVRIPAKLLKELRQTFPELQELSNAAAVRLALRELLFLAKEADKNE